MPEIDPVVLQLRADINNYLVVMQSTTTRVDQMLGDQQKSARELEQQMGRSSAAIKGHLRGLASAIDVKAVIAAIRGALEYAASLEDVAEQVGVSTRALQEYRFAATQVGIAQEEMDDGLSFLSRRLGELATGTEKQRAALEKFGFTQAEIAKLMKMSAEEAIPFLSGKYNELSTSTEKSAFAAEFFGTKVGGRFKTLLGEGAQGIEGLRDAAQKLGIVMDDAMIKKANDASNHLAALETVMKARLAVTVTQNADKILALADRMEQATEKAQRLWNLLVKLADTPVGRGLGFVGDKASYLSAPGLTLRMLDTALSEPAKPKTAAPPAAPRASSGGTQIPFMQRDTPRLPTPPTTFNGWRGTHPPYTPQDLPKLFPSRNAQPIPDFYMRAQLARSLQKFMPGPGLSGALEETGEALDRLNEANADSADKAERVNERVARSFADMSRDVVGSLDGLAGSIRSGGFLEIFGSVLDLLLQLGSIGAFGKTLQTNLNRAPRFGGGRASGGPVLAGGTYLVGERGPELLQMGGRGGFVVPNHLMTAAAARRSAGAANINVTVNARDAVLTQTVAGWVRQGVVEAIATSTVTGATEGERRMLSRGRRRIPG